MVYIAFYAYTLYTATDNYCGIHMLLPSTQPALAPESRSFEMTGVLAFLRPGFLQKKDAHCLHNLCKSPKDRLQNGLLHIKISL